jgi:hypothetical protein
MCLFPFLLRPTRLEKKSPFRSRKKESLGKGIRRRNLFYDCGRAVVARCLGRYPFALGGNHPSSFSCRRPARAFPNDKARGSLALFEGGCSENWAFRGFTASKRCEKKTSPSASSRYWRNAVLSLLATSRFHALAAETPGSFDAMQKWMSDAAPDATARETLCYTCFKPFLTELGRGHCPHSSSLGASPRTAVR